MIDTLWRFEQNVSGLYPLFLLAGAIITLAAGLFVYLSGLGFRKVMFGIIGTYCGTVVGMSLAGFNLMLVLAFVGTSVLLALWLQDSFLVLVATIFSAVYGFSVLIRPYFFPSDDIMAMMRELTIGVPYYNWPILLAIMAAPVAVGSVNWRAASAILCSATASVIFLAGGIMLFKYAGFTVVGYISHHKETCLGLFVVTVALTACVQYFILPRISSRFAAAKESARAKARRARKRKASGGENSSKSTAWRTA